MRVCGFPTWALLDSCLSELRLRWGMRNQEEQPLRGLCSGDQRAGGLGNSASLPWGRLSAQCPVTKGATIGIVSLAVSLRAVTEL